MKTKTLLTVSLLFLTMAVTACSGYAITPTNPSPTPQAPPPLSTVGR